MVSLQQIKFAHPKTSSTITFLDLRPFIIPKLLYGILHSKAIDLNKAAFTLLDIYFPPQTYIRPYFLNKCSLIDYFSISTNDCT